MCPCLSRDIKTANTKIIFVFYSCLPPKVEDQSHLMAFMKSHTKNIVKFYILSQTKSFRIIVQNLLKIEIVKLNNE